MSLTNFRVESDLKKYAQLNGYKAKAWSVTSFKRHLSLRFEISPYELSRAVYTNKIRIYIYYVE